MQRRHRVWLSGHPGNGKPSRAEASDEALAVQFFSVRYDALVGSYLGETNTRLARLFDYARTVPCVLFFDEFDSIGKERGDTHETGEIKRVVSFLLMQIDQLPSYVVTIAATNHAELLDRAVWRRFQIRISFPAPQPDESALFLDRMMEQWPQRPKVSAKALSSMLGASSYAELRDFCQTTRRRQILGLGEIDIESATSTEIDLWATRANPEKRYDGRSEQAVVAPHRERPVSKNKSRTKKHS